MKRPVFALLGMTIFAAGAQAQAADMPLTCALTRAHACTSDAGCVATGVTELDLPRFITIDFDRKVISSLDRNVRRGDTSFGPVERTEGLTVIHGVEKRGWSLAVGEVSGELTITASGDGESFTVFGSCLMP